MQDDHTSTSDKNKSYKRYSHIGMRPIMESTQRHDSNLEHAEKTQVFETDEMFERDGYKFCRGGKKPYTFRSRPKKSKTRKKKSKV